MIRKEFVLVAYLVGVLFSLSMSRAGATATAFQLIATKDDYRLELEGAWDVKTTVIWSESQYVKVGAESESEINISNINGHLYPTWNAGNWKLLKTNSIDFDQDQSLYWERDSFLKANNEFWKVESINKFDFNKPGEFKGVSHHKQYLNGEYVGAYITQSILTKKEELKVSKI